MKETAIKSFGCGFLLFYGFVLKLYIYAVFAISGPTDEDTVGQFYIIFHIRIMA